mmetsp:Transcript_5731/g.16397  ORF Transcript_5731/g.16397 Transcript_5731/m.16397 type:complete len:484 (-) Transcript_5731:949-2400(-)
MHAGCSSSAVQGITARATLLKPKDPILRAQHSTGCKGALQKPLCTGCTAEQLKCACRRCSGSSGSRFRANVASLRCPSVPQAAQQAGAALRRPDEAARLRLLASQGMQANAEQPALDVTIRQAVSSAELRAAAHLRVASFYSYPLDRSEFSARSHRRMKTNQEWVHLEKRIAGTAPDWNSTTVMCLIAVMDELPGDPIAEAVTADLDASCRLPADESAPAGTFWPRVPSTSAASPTGLGLSSAGGDSGNTSGSTSSRDSSDGGSNNGGGGGRPSGGGGGSATHSIEDSASSHSRGGGNDPDDSSPSASDRKGPSHVDRSRPSESVRHPSKGHPSKGVALKGALPQLVVGTLDINVGPRISSEELAGELPARGARMGRAYLTNVCVALGARRRGVAKLLIEEAKRIAAVEGVQWLYVHARSRNPAALALYTRHCGFITERRETEAEAKALSRPPRVLMRFPLSASQGTAVPAATVTNGTPASGQ